MHLWVTAHISTHTHTLPYSHTRTLAHTHTYTHTNFGSDAGCTVNIGSTHIHTRDSTSNSGFHTSTSTNSIVSIPLLSIIIFLAPICRTRTPENDFTTHLYQSKTHANIYSFILYKNTHRIWSVYHDRDRAHEHACLVNARTCDCTETTRNRGYDITKSLQPVSRQFGCDLTSGKTSYMCVLNFHAF